MKNSLYALVFYLILITQCVNSEIDVPSLSNSNALTSSTTSLPTSQPAENKTTYQCFRADHELCFTNPKLLPSRTNTTCKCFSHPINKTAIVCCNVTDINSVLSCSPEYSYNNKFKIKNIHIYNATLNELNISHSFWKELDNMIVTDGHINKLTGRFKKFSQIQCLNVSNNNLVEISQRAIIDTHIKYLDISYNNISIMPRIRSTQEISIDIRGNNAMLCKSVLDLSGKDTPEHKYKFEAPDTTYCLTNPVFSSWFNESETVPIKQLENIKLLQSQCRLIEPDVNCTCETARFQMIFSSGLPEENLKSVDNHHLLITVAVDCSNRNLTELPRNLPPNTESLNVSNNQITSLAGFNDNDNYQHILRFYADNNQISDIREFEGTPFIKQFQVLYLKNNKLKAVS